jgi:hypothetical protein
MSHPRARAARPAPSSSMTLPQDLTLLDAHRAEDHGTVSAVGARALAEAVAPELARRYAIAEDAAGTPLLFQIHADGPPTRETLTVVGRACAVAARATLQAIPRDGLTPRQAQRLGDTLQLLRSGDSSYVVAIARAARWKLPPLDDEQRAQLAAVRAEMTRSQRAADKWADPAFRRATESERVARGEAEVRRVLPRWLPAQTPGAYPFGVVWATWCAQLATHPKGVHPKLPDAHRVGKIRFFTLLREVAAETPRLRVNRHAGRETLHIEAAA